MLAQSFLQETHRSLLLLGTEDGTSAPHVGAISNNKIPNGKHENAALNRPQKKTLIFHERAEKRRQSVWPYLTSARDTHVGKLEYLATLYTS